MLGLVENRAGFDSVVVYYLLDQLSQFFSDGRKSYWAIRHHYPYRNSTFARRDRDTKSKSP